MVLHQAVRLGVDQVLHQDLHLTEVQALVLDLHLLEVVLVVQEALLQSEEALHLEVHLQGLVAVLVKDKSYLFTLIKAKRIGHLPDPFLFMHTLKP